MSAIQASPSAASHEPKSAPAPAPPSTGPVGHRFRLGLLKLIAIVGVIAAVALGLPSLTTWVEYRRSHSITDDAFVEAHIVNVAPEMVSGRIVRFLAEENDSVLQGQVVVEIDPIPFQDKVELRKLSSIPRRRSSRASTPTWTGFARRSRSRSRSRDGHSPRPRPTGAGPRRR